MVSWRTRSVSCRNRATCRLCGGGGGLSLCARRKRTEGDRRDCPSSCPETAERFGIGLQPPSICFATFGPGSTAHFGWLRLGPGSVERFYPCCSKSNQRIIQGFG